VELQHESVFNSADWLEITKNVQLFWLKFPRTSSKCISFAVIVNSCCAMQRCRRQSCSWV